MEHPFLVFIALMLIPVSAILIAKPELADRVLTHLIIKSLDRRDRKRRRFK